MKKRFLIIIFTGLLLGACGYIGPQSMPMNYEYDNLQGGKFTSNGQQIYFSAADQSGEYISYTGGPNFGGTMMGSYLTCASCHGADGRGGTHYMHMQVMDAPPIYYDALVNMMQEESSGASQSDGYTLDNFRQSVFQGKHPDGDELNRNMPRWQMSENDLADLLAFLKTLP
ncbi:MAG: c-type cytochrome [Anaerolineales bacterium]